MTWKLGLKTGRKKNQVKHTMEMEWRSGLYRDLTKAVAALGVLN